jgi:ABC-2 type transport system permease protein
MSFPLLFKDELKGFYKSKVMIFLWIGLPLMTILVHLWSPDTGGAISLTALSAIVISSLGGTLAAVMLTVSIIHEKTRHVYDLFLIRPIKRWKLIISKFLAVYVCLIIASILAIILGMAIDYFSAGLPQEAVLNDALQSFAISISMMAVSGAAGILIGVAAPSVLVGTILVIYGGNQISSIPLIPSILKISNSVPVTILLGAIISCVLLATAVLIFNKKQF